MYNTFFDTFLRSSLHVHLGYGARLTCYYGEDSGEEGRPAPSQAPDEDPCMYWGTPEQCVAASRCAYSRERKRCYKSAERALALPVTIE